MTEQRELFDCTIQARFEKFDAENPSIRRLFIQYANEALKAGRRRIGAKAIAERIRWQAMVETWGDEFKINNNYVSRYARAVAQQRPELAGLFETRTLKSR